MSYLLVRFFIQASTFLQSSRDDSRTVKMNKNTEWSGTQHTQQLQASCMLRPVPPFVTAHAFCASQVWYEIFEFRNEFAY